MGIRAYGHMAHGYVGTAYRHMSKQNWTLTRRAGRGRRIWGLRIGKRMPSCYLSCLRQYTRSRPGGDGCIRRRGSCVGFFLHISALSSRCFLSLAGFLRFWGPFWYHFGFDLVTVQPKGRPRGASGGQREATGWPKGGEGNQRETKRGHGRPGQARRPNQANPGQGNQVLGAKKGNDTKIQPTSRKRLLENERLA